VLDLGGWILSPLLHLHQLVSPLGTFSVSPTMCFLAGGISFPSPRDIWQCLEVVLVVIIVGQACPRYLLDRGQPNC
jgi:hypothetical protein